MQIMRRRRKSQDIISIGFIMTFAFLLCIVVVVQLSSSGVMGWGGGGGNYLYNPAENSKETSQDVYPIVDYISPKKSNSETKEDHETRDTHPDFIYSEDNGPRVVEFYSPWCGHCQHYKPKYIQLGRDVQKLHSEIQFHAVSCQMHKSICQDQNVRGFPTLKWFDAGNSTGNTVRHGGLTAEDLIEKYLLSNDNRPDEPLAHKKRVTPVIIEEADWKANRPAAEFELKKDTTHALDFTFRHSIFMTHGPLTLERSAVLNQWLRLLQKVLPDTMTKARKQVDTLLDQFDDAVSTEERFRSILGKEDRVVWSNACANGGYTCGLWELLHLVTFGVVAWNEKSDNGIATSHAAEILKDFIGEYFTCDECRVNFLKMYDACEFDRCNRLNDDSTPGGQDEWKQLPLWLWETHNDVNVRLHMERSQKSVLSDVDKMKVQWPSRDQCRDCWNGDGTWNEEIVYNYLRSYYWHDGQVVERLTYPSKHNKVFADYFQMNIFPMQVIFSIGTLVFLMNKWRIRRKRHIGRHKKCDAHSDSCVVV